MTRTCDMVVVGARVGGAATAQLLAEAGLDVVVVDRATFPSDTRSTHSIATHGSLLLQQWGLWDGLLATSAPNPRVLGARLGGFDLEVPAAEDAPGSFSPRRTVLDHVLVDAARQAGAEVGRRRRFATSNGDGSRPTVARSERT